MEVRINKCLDIINENIQFFNENGYKPDLNKEEASRYKKIYRSFLIKTMEDIKVEVEKYHTNNDLYSKYEKLDTLIHDSPEFKEDQICHFTDDVDCSMSALTVNYKQKYLESLLKADKAYDVAIDQLEKKVSSNKTGILNYMKKVNESLEN